MSQNSSVEFKQNSLQQQVPVSFTMAEIVSSKMAYPLLMAPGADYSQPMVVRSIAEFQLRNVEQAGHGHLKIQLSRSGQKARGQMAAKAIKTEEEDDSNDPVTSDEKKRMTLAMDGGNHYEILGLGQLNIVSTLSVTRRFFVHVRRSNGDTGGLAAWPPTIRATLTIIDAHPSPCSPPPTIKLNALTRSLC